MNKILIIKTHALGDVLMTTPVIRAIHKHLPSTKLYYLTTQWAEPAVKNNPYLEKVFIVDNTAIFNREIHKLLFNFLDLRKLKFDAILIFSGSVYLHLLARMIRSGVRIGFSENSSLLTHSINIKVLQKYYAPKAYCSFLEPLNIPHDGYSMDFMDSPAPVSFELDSFLSNYKTIIGLFCGGGKNPINSVICKQWPKEKFISLGKRLSKLNIGIVLFGSEHEKKLNNELSKEIGSTSIDISGQFNFARTADIMKQCDLIITNDSAPFHLAISSGVRTIALFGPSNPDLVAPNQKDCIVIKSKLFCSPCYGNSIFRGCGKENCTVEDCQEQNSMCMDDISVDEVYENAKKMLKKPKEVRLAHE